MITFSVFEENKGHEECFLEVKTTCHSCGYEDTFSIGLPIDTLAADVDAEICALFGLEDLGRGRHLCPACVKQSHLENAFDQARMMHKDLAYES